MCREIVLLLLLVSQTITENVESPRIVIVGAGASGIAAAAKLLENGFENVLVLEAEDRIGGRIHTTIFDDYVVDLGAQWVHGEKGNVVHEMAHPLGLIEHATMEGQMYDMYTSSGGLIDVVVNENAMTMYKDILDQRSTGGYNGSIGDYFEERQKVFFANHPEIDEKLRKQLLWHMNLLETSLDPADSWNDTSARDSEYLECEGDRIMNWKERGYSTILDILMKKIPNPEEELPIMNNTILNAEVTRIDYTAENGTVKLTTSDGKEYQADHVIMTPSLGVLKAQHETLFHPALPQSKVRNIKGLGFGNACKIYLAFDELPWEERKLQRSGFSFLWSDDERREYDKDPATKWLPSTIGFFFVQHKPRLLLGWVSGRGARLIEGVSDEQVLNQTMHMLHTFLSRDYNISQPVAMLRSHWHKNKHFRGTYSYRSLETDRTNSSAEQLAEPIMNMGIPIILFAGEATSKHYFSTVHGAIGSGRREAERLIDLYNALNNKPTKAK